MDSVELSKHRAFLNFPGCGKETWLTGDSVFDVLRAHALTSCVTFMAPLLPSFFDLQSSSPSTGTQPPEATGSLLGLWHLTAPPPAAAWPFCLRSSFLSDPLSHPHLGLVPPHPIYKPAGWTPDALEWHPRHLICLHLALPFSALVPSVSSACEPAWRVAHGNWDVLGTALSPPHALSQQILPITL